MAWMPLQLLIVEDRPDDAELLLAELKRAGYDPAWTRVETAEDFAAGLARNPDIIVCDYSLPSMTAPDALRILREQGSGYDFSHDLLREAAYCSASWAATGPVSSTYSSSRPAVSGTPRSWRSSNGWRRR